MNSLYINQLFAQLTADLERINLEISDTIAKHSAMAIKSKSVVQILRKHIITENFKSQEEEINFFKNIKPKFSSLVYYHEKVFTIESKMPHGTAEQKSVYLAHVITKIDNFYINNTEFSTYMKKGSSANDASYFVVGNRQLTLGLGLDYHDFDPLFGSIHSSLVARFIGAQKALAYANMRLMTIDGFGEPYMDDSRLEYTGTATEIIELAYALHI